MATKKSTTRGADFPIRIDVDKQGNFTYTLMGGNGSSIQPPSGMTVSWDLFVKGRRQPFSIEFDETSPFGVNKQIIRSFGGPTAPQTVKVSKFFRGNLCMKYSVQLTNGWTDDPDIVPIPADSFKPLVFVTLNPPLNLYQNPE